MEKTAAENWNKMLARWHGSFLQSDEWRLFQQSLGREVIRESDEDWMWQAVLRGRGGLKYLLCSYGPVCTNKNAASRAIESLIDTSKRLGCDFVRVEPTEAPEASTMRQMGANKIGEVQPEHTQMIDLTKPVEDLCKGLASGHRNLINGTQRRGISIEQSTSQTDFEHFLNMLADTAARSKVTFYPRSYYQQLWKTLVPLGAMKLYVARFVPDKVENQAKGNSALSLEPSAFGLAHKGQVGGLVAAALFYDWGGRRIYAHAGAYQDLNRKVNASVSLVWQAILDAKEAGMKQFDLWGVAPDNDPGHKWAGITKFKKGFGGQPVNYNGTWDIPINKPKYALYSLYRKLRGRD